MGSGWVQWPVFLVYLFLVLKAYQWLRDHHGSRDGSWLEGVGAFYVAPLLAPFLPLVWLNAWVERRREAAQIRSGGGPLSIEQRLDQQNLAVGAVVLVGVLAIVLALLLASAR